MPAIVHQFICRNDNFGLLVHDASTGKTASIDTPDATKILNEVTAKGWRLDYIFNTHHHHDHVGGNLELKEKTGCQIVGARDDKKRIPGIDIEVGDNDVFQFGNETVTIIDTPGHTIGHIAYWFNASGLVFVGDTLFSLGCGKLFEGTPAVMLDTLNKLAALPDDTKIYCGHEYTLDNARFALSVEEKNHELQERVATVKALRAVGKATLPVTLATEKKTNPFLRTFSQEIRKNLGLAGAEDAEVLAKLREKKNNF